MKRIRGLFIGCILVIGGIVATIFVTQQLWHAKFNDPEDFIQYNETDLAVEGIQTIEANGLRFAYLEAGEGPLVLLVHGFPDSAHSFKPLMNAIADDGYHAVAYFQRGYVPTEIPEDGDYSALTLGKDLIALIDAFGEEEAIVIGHDWGATAVYAAANQNPEKISKLVTISIPHPRITEVNRELLQRAPHFLQLSFGFASEWLVRRNDWRYLDELIAYWSPNWDATEMLTESKADFREPGRLRAALGYYASLSRSQDQLLVLQAKTSAPALTIIGREDGPVDVADFADSDSAYTDEFSLVIIEDAGHFVHQEAPEELLAELQDFLNDED